MDDNVHGNRKICRSGEHVEVEPADGLPTGKAEEGEKPLER